MDTNCFQNFPSSSISFGGNIVFKISSKSFDLCDDDEGDLDEALNDPERALGANVNPSDSANTG